MKEKVLLPYAILGNTTWFAHYLQFPEVVVELNEHFVKQSYRSRSTILGANGPLDLIVPIEHGRAERVPMKNVRIAYHHDWQREQWQSLVSAYRASPYFEYFERDVEPVWFEKHEKLVDRSRALLELSLALMHEKVRHSVSNSYEKDPRSTDRREAIHPKKRWPLAEYYPIYTQVFEDRHPFTPDLSVFDLLFNLGPDASKYLRNLKLEA